MKALQVFNSAEFGEFSLIEIDGKPYFPATQSAKILGYSNPQEAIRTHCKGVREMLTPSNGGNQRVKYITEGDLYRLIARSKLPNAERFERWVFDEVLPSIRKLGAYMTEPTIDKILADPDFGITLLTQLKEERRKTRELEAEKEPLEIALNESLKFYTVARYNRHFGMEWNMKETQAIGKRIAAYCRTRSIEIRLCEINDERFGAVNSYPLTAWEGFLLGAAV